MSVKPSKTVSARVAPTVHLSILAALRPEEKINDFLIEAIANELARRRTKTAQEVSLSDLGKLAQAAMSQTTATHVMLLSMNTRLEKIMKEMEIPE